MDRGSNFDAMERAVQSGIACVLYAVHPGSEVALGHPVETLAGLHRTILDCTRDGHAILVFASTDGYGPHFVFCEQLTDQAADVIGKSYGAYFGGLLAQADTNATNIERMH